MVLSQPIVTFPWIRKKRIASSVLIISDAIRHIVKELIWKRFSPNINRPARKISGLVWRKRFGRFDNIEQISRKLI
ncbi:MAG: hypothetical protein HOI15_09615 [Opitutales bacterium]|nr:hypothetical protein [Opitutales bacterium]